METISYLVDHTMFTCELHWVLQVANWSAEAVA